MGLGASRRASRDGSTHSAPDDADDSLALPVTDVADALHDGAPTSNGPPAEGTLVSAQRKTSSGQLATGLGTIRAVRRHTFQDLGAALRSGGRGGGRRALGSSSRVGSPLAGGSSSNRRGRAALRSPSQSPEMRRSPGRGSPLASAVRA